MFMRTTILIETETRELLREIGKKNQTYDQLINELVGHKRKEIQRDQDSPDRRLETLQSIESRRP
jgi:hypothetical protein